MSFLDHYTSVETMSNNSKPVAVTSSSGVSSNSGSNSSYEYLPAKAIDLMGDEFTSKSVRSPSAPQTESIMVSASSNSVGANNGTIVHSTPNVVVVSALPSSAQPQQPQVQSQQPQILQAVPHTSLPASLVSSLANTVVISSCNTTSHLDINTSQSGSTSVLPASSAAHSFPLGTVTLDLSNSATAAAAAAVAAGHLPSNVTTVEDNSGGVLLCNLDELSRYIPENFYTDFSLNESSGATNTAPGTIEVAPTKLSAATAPIISLSNGTLLQAPLTTLPTSASTVCVSSGGNGGGGPITIQLPTQPQPVQSVKSVTYVQTNKSSGNITTNATFQPVKLTTTGYAYTANGERIAIQGLAPDALTAKGSNNTVQLQLKPSSGVAGGSAGLSNCSSHHTLQLQPLNLDPSKFTILHELPDVGKIVIQQDGRGGMPDSIASILEEMKSSGGNESPNSHDSIVTLNSPHGTANVEYTTAIPVAFTNLPDQVSTSSLGNRGNSNKKMNNNTIVLPAGGLKKASTTGSTSARNIIFAGNTLPQGAIPIQINGLNALPISAVKSIPMPINLSTLSPQQQSAGSFLTTLPQQPHVVMATKKGKGDDSKEPIVTSVMDAISGQIVNKVNSDNNNKTSTKKNSSVSRPALGSNKTCTWPFENGEICGKTFTKTYNLKVHERMHLDERPFQCAMCDQRFRQKAHLQRHETTHGIGVKVSSRSGGGANKRRRSSTKRGAMVSPGRGGNVGMVTRVQVNVADAVSAAVAAAAAQARQEQEQQQQQVQSELHMTESLQRRLARVNEQFKLKDDSKDDDDSNALNEANEEEEHDDLYHAATSPAVIKSYRKHKFSATQLELDAAMKMVQAEENQMEADNADNHSVIDFKDGQPFLAAATAAKRPKLHDGSNTVVVSVEHQHHHPDAVAAAVSEAGLDEAHDMVVTSDSASVLKASDSVLKNVTTDNPELLNAILINKVDEAGNIDEDSKVANVHVEQQPHLDDAFPPVSVQEYHQGQ